ncbi:hypothetical protein D3C72_1914340 [compost metagenome]
MQRYQVGMQACRPERRGLVADDHRAAAALGLDRFADIVDDVRIDHRHAAQHQVRLVGDRQAALLARRPFLCAVRAVVHQRLAILARPQVGRHVEVVQRRDGGVVQRLLVRFIALAARRHRHQHHVAELQARDHEAGFAVARGRHRRLLRVAPALRD